MSAHDHKSDDGDDKMDNETADNSTLAFRPQGNAAVDDAERLISTGDRLLRNQQTRLITARTDYERKRSARMSYYRGEMQKVADAAEHELNGIDRAWESERQHIEMMIRKLKALGGV